MYAIIQTGGKQYRVAAGDQLEVEKLPVTAGNEVSFDQVLLIGGNGEAKIGTPFIPAAQVLGEVISQDKGEKLVIMKYKKRKGYDKKTGHRQLLTTVKIKEIKS